MLPLPFPLGLFRRLAPLLPLSLLMNSGAAVWAENVRQTVCCRASGGTRGSCLTSWAHLVPPGNRLNPGSPSRIAILVGLSENTAGMTFRLLTMNEQQIVEHHLQPQDAGVNVLTLPSPTPPSVVWESFPTCSPDRPPTRSILDHELPQAEGPAIRMLRHLGASCGGSVETAALLRAFDLESLQENLPATLPVRCETLPL